MEDVSGKKILDFSGRMVHNETHLVNPSQKMCCKTHMKGIKSEEKTTRGIKPVRPPARRNENARRRIGWRAARISMENARFDGVPARLVFMGRGRIDSFFTKNADRNGG